MVYTVTFNPALDYTLSVDSLCFERINRASDAEISYGGKGINVSVILTRLGVENTALGFSAGFTGKELEALLNADNIKNDFVHIENGATRINVKIRYGKELDINTDGAQISEKDIATLNEKLNIIESGDYLVLAGSVPKTLKNSGYELILESLKHKDLRLIVDAEDELLLGTLKYKPFLIKPNHHELGAIFNADIDSDEKAVFYAKELQKLGAQNVLVSLAERGAILVDEHGNIHKISNAEGTLINSVGCGDSMLAGFIAGYIKSGDYAEALKLAGACGNATAFSQGLAKKSEIERIYNSL